MFTKLFLFVYFLSVQGVAQSQELSDDKSKAFQIFKNQVYPFLQKQCAECHGQNQFGAPQHSPLDNPRASYEQILGYVHLAPDWMSASRLISFGGTRHCQEYTGNSSCGADRNELVSVVQGWIEEEITARSRASQKQSRSAKDLVQIAQIKTPENAPSLKIVQISTKGFSSCALFENDKAKCWGNNSVGQLGIGSTAKFVGVTPEEIKSLPYVMIDEPIKQIIAGETHTCALLRNGKAKCWGYNYYGQLGVGSKNESLGTISSEMKFLPYVMIEGIIMQIAVGSLHTCALYQARKTTGIKCWGYNKEGELGIGSRVDAGRTQQEMKSLRDVQIDLQADGPVKQLVAGFEHTCVVFTNGKAKCWGANHFGLLGIGIRGYAVGTRPQEMKTLPYVMIDEPIKQIEAGRYHTCALLQNGKMKCWGRNNSQDLGIAVTKDYFGKTAEEMKSLPYVLIDEPISQIATGVNHTCVLLQDGKGTVKCWRANTFGQLGIGSFQEIVGRTFEEMKSLQAVQCSQKILQVEVSIFHTCFLVEGGKMKCTGRNAYGELGMGDTKDRGVYDVDGTDELADVQVSAGEP